jgi:hypothetical protein
MDTKKSEALAVLNAFADRELNRDVTTNENGKSLNPISRSHVKQIALAYAKRTKAHPYRFSRVSRSFLNAVESNALSFIKDRINRHPSRGQTLT